MTRILLSTLALLPFLFACQPEPEAAGTQGTDGLVTVESGVYGTLYASIEVVETYRLDSPYRVYAEANHFITFWADSARTVPATLGNALNVNYASVVYHPPSNYTTSSDQSVYLQPGSHSYYLLSQATEDCYYGANGSPEGLCYNAWLALKNGFGYETGY
ncbi:hypothetical protein ACLESD_03190 [Pyxidicoccus sp. 3LFB2]